MQAEFGTKTPLSQSLFFIGCSGALIFKTMTEIKEQKLKEGDRVFSYGFGYEQHNGTIHKNTEYPEVSEWYIKYDDGEECAVVDINGVYKIDS